MDDLEFVQKCIQGDKQYWDQFVDKYSHLIYSYINSVLRVKGLSLQQDNVDDIFQDIFVLLTKDNFHKLKSFKGKNSCSLASWLRQVTINFTISCTRRLKPVVSLDQEDDDELILKDIIADNSPAVGSALTQKERIEHLQDCIDKLEKEDKYFLELHLNQGIPLEKLTEYLGISRGAIDMRKWRIIDRLKHCFKNKGFFKLDL